MSNKYLLPVLTFTMKYFFDVEKEVTQELISSASAKLHLYRDLINGVMTLNK